MNTNGMPRFNAQQERFGQAAQHNADYLQGRKLYTMRETAEQRDINRKANLKGVRPAGKNADGKQLNNDEVAPASTSASRGGSSSIRPILETDNKRHGGALARFYDKYVQSGEWFIYE